MGGHPTEFFVHTPGLRMLISELSIVEKQTMPNLAASLPLASRGRRIYKIEHDVGSIRRDIERPRFLTAGAPGGGVSGRA